MKNIVKKQHWIPKFILKKWMIDDKIKIIDYKTSEIYNSKFSKNNKFSYDPFYEEDFYEDTINEVNKIENKLSKIENDFSRIIKKVQDELKNIHKERININRRELEIIKFYISINSRRGKTLFDRTKNLDGDSLFNEKMKGMSENEIRIHYNNIIEQKIDLFYERQNSKSPEEAKSFTKEKNVDNISDWISNMDNFWDEMSLTTLKIFISKTNSFLLTDSNSTQIIGPKFAPAATISYFVFAPNIMFALLPGTHDNFFPSRLEPLNDDYLFIIDKLSLPNDFFQKNHKHKYKNGWESKGEILNGIIILKPKSYEWNDIFEVKKNFLTRDQSITINSFLLNQSMNHCVFINKNDYFDSRKREKELGIYRVEENNREY